MQDHKRTLPKLASYSGYKAWSKQMELHFRACNSWEIVLQSESRPPAQSSDAREKFDKKSAAAFFDLLSALKRDLKDLALTYDTVGKAWEALKSSCGFANEVELQKLQEEFENLRPERSVYQTLNRFKLY